MKKKKSLKCVRTASQMYRISRTTQFTQQHKGIDILHLQTIKKLIFAQFYQFFPYFVQNEVNNILQTSEPFPSS